MALLPDLVHPPPPPPGPYTVLSSSHHLADLSPLSPFSSKPARVREEGMVRVAETLSAARTLAVGE